MNSKFNQFLLATAVSLSLVSSPAMVSAATKVPAKTVTKPTLKKPAVKVQKWTGVITGIENSEIFYLKQVYKRNTGELRFKVTPETKFIRIPTAASINDFEGGDWIEIEGIKLDAKTMQANTIKYVSDKYKEL